MIKNEFFTEGDINFSEERHNWDNQVSDPLTRSILDDDARYFLHQSMSTPCLDVADRCSGSGITTLSGKHIIDFHGNNVHQLGYGNEYISEKIKQQISKLSFSPRRFTNIPAVELAKKLANILPGTLNRTLFAPGGTLAVGMAIKLARVVTGKYKLISVWDSFHGASLDSISAGGEEVFHKYMEHLLPGVIHIPPVNTYRGLFGDSELDQLNYARYLEYVIEKEGNIGEMRKELGERWNIKWQNTEKIRFSNEQEIFFDQLRIMTKYHMWQKAGGGIVNNLRDENDTIISDTNEMNKKIKKFFEDIHLALRNIP